MLPVALGTLGNALGFASGLARLFGGRRRDNSTSNTNSTTTSQGQSITESNSSSSTSYGSTTTYDIRNMTPEAFEALNRAMMLTEKISQEFYSAYSPENAEKRAEEGMAQIFREYRETQLPQIFTQQAGAGLYNSTTGQLLANDAFARATDLANARKFEIEKEYANLRLSGVGMFLRSLDVAKGAVKQGSESTSGGSSTSSSGTSITNSNQVSNTVGTNTSTSRQRGNSLADGLGQLSDFFSNIGKK